MKTELSGFDVDDSFAKTFGEVDKTVDHRKNGVITTNADIFASLID
jgi:hypothetical protein